MTWLAVPPDAVLNRDNPDGRPISLPIGRRDPLLCASGGDVARTVTRFEKPGVSPQTWRSECLKRAANTRYNPRTMRQIGERIAAGRRFHKGDWRGSAWIVVIVAARRVVA